MINASVKLITFEDDENIDKSESEGLPPVVKEFIGMNADVITNTLPDFIPDQPKFVQRRIRLRQEDLVAYKQP